MFGSTILDLAIGVIFSFLMLSLVTSATTESFASAVGWRAIPPAERRRQLLARAFPPLLARSFNPPPSRQRVTPKTFPSQKGRRQIWLRSGFVFTTVRWGERVAPVAMAQVAQAQR